MAPEPMSRPEPAAFAATKLAPLLRALVDPEGKGDLTVEQAASIERVEQNLASFGDRTKPPADS